MCEKYTNFAVLNLINMKVVNKNYLDAAFNLKSLSAAKLLTWMMFRMNTANREIPIAAKTRDEIKEELGINPNYLTNLLKTLKDSGYITGEKGLFYISKDLADSILSVVDK